MADKAEQTSTTDLERQLEALRDDFSGIASLLRNMAGETAGKAVSDARDTADNLSRDAARRGYETREALDGAIKGHPVAAIGIAAAVGFMLGILARR